MSKEYHIIATGHETEPERHMTSLSRIHAKIFADKLRDKGFKSVTITDGILGQG